MFIFLSYICTTNILDPGSCFVALRNSRSVFQNYDLYNISLDTQEFRGRTELFRQFKSVLKKLSVLDEEKVLKIDKLIPLGSLNRDQFINSLFYVTHFILQTLFINPNREYIDILVKKENTIFQEISPDNFCLQCFQYFVTNLLTSGSTKPINETSLYFYDFLKSKKEKFNEIACLYFNIVTKLIEMFKA